MIESIYFPFCAKFKYQNNLSNLAPLKAMTIIMSSIELMVVNTERHGARNEVEPVLLHSTLTKKKSNIHKLFYTSS